MVITDRNRKKEIMVDPEIIEECAVIRGEIPAAVFAMQGITRK
ncbi:MAG: hypothetical protein V1697_02600 [Candidatus Levyibacteriota bacterium]